MPKHYIIEVVKKDGGSFEPKFYAFFHFLTPFTITPVLASTQNYEDIEDAKEDRKYIEENYSSPKYNYKVIEIEI